MLKTKAEILKLLNENNISRSYSDIYISEKNKDGYIISFILSFGKNNLVFSYDEIFGYISYFYKG